MKKIELNKVNYDELLKYNPYLKIIALFLKCDFEGFTEKVETTDDFFNRIISFKKGNNKIFKKDLFDEVWYKIDNSDFCVVKILQSEFKKLDEIVKNNNLNDIKSIYKKYIIQRA